MQEGAWIFLGQSRFCLFDLLSLCTVFFFGYLPPVQRGEIFLFKMDSAFVNQDL